MSASSEFVDGAATTVQLTAPSGKSTGDFDAGVMEEATAAAAAVDITEDDYTEIEWCLKSTANVEADATYDFRVTVGGTVLDTYTVTPKWIFSAAPAGGNAPTGVIYGPLFGPLAGPV